MEKIVFWVNSEVDQIPVAEGNHWNPLHNVTVSWVTTFYGGFVVLFLISCDKFCSAVYFYALHINKTGLHLKMR